MIINYQLVIIRKPPKIGPYVTSRSSAPALAEAGRLTGSTSHLEGLQGASAIVTATWLM